jgi:hypothetical protein
MHLIPTSASQDRCAQSRIPIDVIFHGCATSLFHASQQRATMSSQSLKIRFHNQLSRGIAKRFRRGLFQASAAEGTAA